MHFYCNVTFYKFVQAYVCHLSLFIISSEHLVGLCGYQNRLSLSPHLYFMLSISVIAVVIADLWPWLEFDYRDIPVAEACAAPCFRLQWVADTRRPLLWSKQWQSNIAFLLESHFRWYLWLGTTFTFSPWGPNTNHGTAFVWSGEQTCTQVV